MKKAPLNKKKLKKAVNTTQRIEGYAAAGIKARQKIKHLKELHGLKVSISK